jgi:uncharacterized protein YxjI
MGGFTADTFLIREHVGFLKLHEAYDILTPDGTVVGTAVERASGFTQFLKLLISKTVLPFTVEIVDASGGVLVTIKRSFALFRSRVTVHDEHGEQLGYFLQKVFSLGGAFRVFDVDGQQIATLQGNWSGWEFKFVDRNDVLIGQVSKKWAGLAKELFTSADSYVVHLEREKVTDVRQVQLLLAAAICIDMVLKESGG